MMQRKHSLIKAAIVFVGAPLLWLTYQGANSSPIDEVQPLNHHSESDLKSPLLPGSQSMVSMASASALVTENEESDSTVIHTTAHLPSESTLLKEAVFDLDPASHAYTTTVTIDTNDELQGSENRKPQLNQEVYQSLDDAIAGWELVNGVPINYSLAINNLFEDPDNDLLSIRVELSLSGVSAQLNGNLNIKGTPRVSELTPQLILSAKDSYHGDDEQAWTHARFSLPEIESGLLLSHPLEGDVIYRLESSQNFRDQHTLYEVVYCEAFKFVNQEAFYAKANSKTRCPEEDQLNKIGSYVVEDDKLILSSNQSAFHAEQTWTLNHQYASKHLPDTTNYFVAVESNQNTESYTMQKQKESMEARINQVTGELRFQVKFHDYLLPKGDSDYQIVQLGTYLYDHKTETAGPNGETVDSDLNIHAYGQNLSCSMLAHWYESGVVSGLGEYDIEIISTNIPLQPNHSVECFEYVSDNQTGQLSLNFNSNFSQYEKFVEGEVYSYILRPKPQFADKVEELKLNMVYRNPN